MRFDAPLLPPVAISLAAAFSVACGSTSETAPREFRHVDGEAYAPPDGLVRLRKDGRGLTLEVRLVEAPIQSCLRLSLDAHTVTTCTWPAGSTPKVDNNGLVHIDWASASLDVETFNDGGGHILDPSLSWSAGESISIAAEFSLGPPIDETLVGPPLVVLQHPRFEPSFNGAPDAVGITLDTSRDLRIEWEPATIGTVRATLACSNFEAGHAAVVESAAPAENGAMVLPAEILSYLPNTGCTFGSGIQILAGDFREVAAPAWRYQIEVVRTAQTPEGVDASTALTPR
ncbi:MAG: hypothetical protein HYZ29_05430 [Myxococcales bacterium]|nr:hypothetical protein [Myxococcales bacterium]